jgi:DNA-directed RNA polymerase subunit beta
LGQIYETVLAWAGQKLGLKFSTPIFDGASLDAIDKYSTKLVFLEMEKHTYMMAELEKDLISLLQLVLFICLN